MPIIWNRPYDYSYDPTLIHGECELRRLADRRALEIDDVMDLPASAMRVRAGGLDSASLKKLSRLGPCQLQPGPSLLARAFIELGVEAPSPKHAVVRLAQTAARDYAAGVAELRATVFEIQRLCDLSADYLPLELEESASQIGIYVRSINTNAEADERRLQVILEGLAENATSENGPDVAIGRLSDLSALNLIRPSNLPKEAERVVKAGGHSESLDVLSALTPAELNPGQTLVERSIAECQLPPSDIREATRRLCVALAEDFLEGLHSPLGVAEEISMVNESLIFCGEDPDEEFRPVLFALSEWDERPELKARWESMILASCKALVGERDE